MRAVKKILSAAVLIVIGTILVLPIEAKISSSGVTVKWVKSNYYTKKQIKKSYWTKGQTEKIFYRKNYINSLINGYYTSTQVDNALASYLTSSNASSTYLTQSNAASTYLTQSNAASTYLPLGGGTLTGGLTGTSITGTSFAYPSAQTKYLMVSAADIKARGDMQLTASNGGVYHSAGVTNQGIAPVNLPNGTVINSVVLNYYDTNASQYVGGYLMRTAYNNATPEAILWIASTGSGGLGTSSGTVDSGKETIDNSTYYYYFVPSFSASSSGLVIRGFRIEYQISSL